MGSLIEPGTHFHLGWQASRPQRSSCLCLPPPLGYMIPASFFFYLCRFLFSSMYVSQYANVKPVPTEVRNGASSWSCSCKWLWTTWCVCWELSPASVEGQSVLCTVEPSHQPHTQFFAWMLGSDPGSYAYIHSKALLPTEPSPSPLLGDSLCAV